MILYCGKAAVHQSNQNHLKIVNVNDHLRKHTVVQGEKQRAKEQEKDRRTMTMRELEARNYNPNRYHELIFCKLIIKCFEDKFVRLLIEMLSQKQSFNNDKHAKRAKKVY